MITTKTRSVKLPGGLVDAVDQHAKKKGDTFNNIVRKYLERLVKFRKA